MTTPDEYADCNRLKDDHCTALTEKFCSTRGRCPFYRSKKASIFAARLRECRERKGITQGVLADRCCISNVTISQYELGNREPSVMQAKRIADALGVSLDYLCK